MVQAYQNRKHQTLITNCILQVQENSPGRKAGLEPFFDFIISVCDTRLVIIFCTILFPYFALITLGMSAITTHVVGLFVPE